MVNKDSKNKLVTVPKCGYNLIKYCVEYLTEQMTPGRKRRHPDCLNWKGPMPFVHSHSSITLNKGDKLAILYRNYREKTIRETMFQRDYPLLTLDDVIKVYYDILEMYDRYNGEKMIIRYEDLLIDLSPVIDLINFFDLDFRKDPKEFLRNEGFHRKQSLRSVKKSQDVLTDQSDDFYTRKLSITEKENIDSKFEDFSPEMYSKYLKVYKNP